MTRDDLGVIDEEFKQLLEKMAAAENMVRELRTDVREIQSRLLRRILAQEGTSECK